MNKIYKFLKIISPGVIIAMAGVGVGDLATASLVGSRLGVSVLWAVILGAFMKFFITEGCARWQLATGSSILEGCMTNLGRWFKIPFIIYFVFWSYFVSAALISASGVAMTAILPLADHSKLIYGMIHSVIAGVLIWQGGFKLFARIMEFCAVLLFVTVIISVSQFEFGADFFRGILTPSLPIANPQSVSWIVALIGGVGGTLTVICYCYWIKEVGRNSVNEIKTCRIDLGVGYALTALFGMAMVILGSKVDIDSSKGFNILLNISDVLKEQSGTWASNCFLIGAWGAVFSSMMGVWQAAPYILTDFISQGKAEMKDAHKNKYYRLWLIFIVFVPMLSLFVEFSLVQKYYSYFGALVVPFLTSILLILNRKRFIAEYRNKPSTVFVGVLILIFFVVTIVGLGIIPS